jgi:hypothetical protein
MSPRSTPPLRGRGARRPRGPRSGATHGLRPKPRPPAQGGQRRRAGRARCPQRLPPAQAARGGSRARYAGARARSPLERHSSGLPVWSRTYPSRRPAVRTRCPARVQRVPQRTSTRAKARATVGLAPSWPRRIRRSVLTGTPAARAKALRLAGATHKAARTVVVRFTFTTQTLGSAWAGASGAVVQGSVAGSAVGLVVLSQSPAQPLTCLGTSCSPPKQRLRDCACERRARA